MKTMIYLPKNRQTGMSNVNSTIILFDYQKVILEYCEKDRIERKRVEREQKLKRILYEK